MVIRGGEGFLNSVFVRGGLDYLSGVHDADMFGITIDERHYCAL